MSTLHSDGRPFSADTFINRLLAAIEERRIGKWELVEALTAWNEGAWDEACAYISLGRP